MFLVVKFFIQIFCWCKYNDKYEVSVKASFSNLSVSDIRFGLSVVCNPLEIPLSGFDTESDKQMTVLPINRTPICAVCSFTMSCFRVEMGGEGGSRKEGGGVVAAGQVLQKRMGLRIVLGALCVGAVVGLSLAIALPATQAAEQVSEQWLNYLLTGFSFTYKLCNLWWSERHTLVAHFTGFNAGKTHVYFWLADSRWREHWSDLPGFEEFWPIFRWLDPDSRLSTLLCYNWWLGPDGHEVGEATKIIQFGPTAFTNNHK